MARDIISQIVEASGEQCAVFAKSENGDVCLESLPVIVWALLDFRGGSGVQTKTEREVHGLVASRDSVVFAIDCPGFVGYAHHQVLSENDTSYFESKGRKLLGLKPPEVVAIVDNGHDEEEETETDGHGEEQTEPVSPVEEQTEVDTQPRRTYEEM